MDISVLVEKMIFSKNDYSVLEHHGTSTKFQESLGCFVIVICFMQFEEYIYSIDLDIDRYIHHLESPLRSLKRHVFFL